MRTLLVTGPGGAGTSTVAAATALAAARAGRRTLLITPGPHPLPGEPDGPAVHTVDSRQVFTERAVDLQSRLGALFDLLGATPLDSEEFTELPGADAFALLQALSAARGHDVVVADLPPLPHALSLLALPGRLRRYLARLLPEERQAARALRPVLAQLVGVPMPADFLYDAAARWDAELAAVQAVLGAAATRVRLVAEPGGRSTAAVRTARTALALYGMRLEDMVATRVLPGAGDHPFYGPMAAAQAAHLADLRAEAADAGVALHEVAHLGAAGEDAARRITVPAPPAGAGGDGPAPEPWTVEDRLAQEGRLIWRLPLPRATREGLDLVRRGDELVVDAGGFRHIMPLPAALRRCGVEGAALRDGALQVRFAPDPSQWPR